MLNKDRFYKELEHLVNIDSGSYCAQGVTAVASWFASHFEKLGWQSVWYDKAPQQLGKSVFVSPADVNEEIDLLIICHTDTVFPAGEVAQRPFSTGENRIFGPGAADMKAGCLFTLYALEQLIAENAGLGKIGVLFNGEHEIGCPNTRAVIEHYAGKSRIVITAEPTRANGAHVKQRKGILRYTLKFEGKSAHAGNNPQDGVCAVTEMAHWILFFKSLENIEKEITVNPGIARGGQSVNAVPDQAELRVDIRTCTQEDSVAIDAAVKAHLPVNSKIRFSLEGGITRPPMVPNAQTEELCMITEEIGKALGLQIHWAFAGGGSDASFASALGKPALCGLTPVSGKLHTKEEYIDTSDIEARFSEYKEIIRRFSIHVFEQERLSQVECA